MDMKSCKRVSKFKMVLKGSSRAVTTGRIVQTFGDTIDMDMEFCKRVSKGAPGSPRGMPHPCIKGLISQKPFISPPLNHLFFVCVEVLWPSQPNGVMSSAVSLPNHTFTGQA